MEAETIEEADTAVLLQNHSSHQMLPVISLSSAWNHRKTLVRFVSAEVIVFSFMFTLNYYQHYSQQYFFQWYAIQALENVSYSPANKSICYNQTLINEFSGSNQTINEVEEQTAHMNLMVTLVTSVPSIFINLLLAPLSDTLGRKPAMIFVLTGETLAVVFAVIVTYLNLNPYWFIGSAVWIGLSGGMFTLVSVGFAYGVDVTPLRWRTAHLGLLQAMIYIATALSSGVLNVWLQGTYCDFRPPVWLMVVSVTIGLVYSLLLPESIQKENRAKLSGFKQRSHVLIKGLRIFFWPYLGYSIWRLWAVLLSIFVAVLGEAGESTIATLFLLHKPLVWNLDLIGYYGILRSVSHGLALFLVLPILTFFKLPDPFIVLVGIAFTCGMNVFVGFVDKTWEMFVVAVFQGMESITIPSLLSMNSKIVRQEDQGALFSISSTISAVSAILGSLLYNLIYPFTLKQGLPPGSSYWLMAIIWTIPVPLMLVIWGCRHKEPNLSPPVEASVVNTDTETESLDEKNN